MSLFDFYVSLSPCFFVSVVLGCFSCCYYSPLFAVSPVSFKGHLRVATCVSFCLTPLFCVCTFWVSFSFCYVLVWLHLLPSQDLSWEMSLILAVMSSLLWQVSTLRFRLYVLSSCCSIFIISLRSPVFSLLVCFLGLNILSFCFILVHYFLLYDCLVLFDSSPSLLFISCSFWCFELYLAFLFFVYPFLFYSLSVW